MIILGIMSGTSLDGVDLALCDIDADGYRILSAETVDYPREWVERLSTLENATALEYVRADVELGHYIGLIASDFIKSQKYTVEAIASHGHTIFHQPQLGFTAQIGDGEAIAAETGLPVVYNFRGLDVALGGQGAPLVPIGDELLFGEYDACLNLGGIANISYRLDGKRVAYDICPCNMVLNRLAQELGEEYDKDGAFARSGLFNYYLNETLNQLDYYKFEPPKSLGKEWFVERFWPVVAASRLSVKDQMRTCTEHIARQIADVLQWRHVRTLLVTGGGAHNAFLIECLSSLQPDVEVMIPEDVIVNFKEAVIFAFLGYLRLNGKVNTLASVTGARIDSVGGSISGMVIK